MIKYYPTFEIDLYIIIPLFWFIIYIYILKKYKNNNALLNSVILIRMIFWGIASFIITMCLLFHTLYPIYCFNTGKYEIIEGYVEDFKPGSSTDNKMEGFSINGICFKYSDGVISGGYNRTINHGGVIRGNGQHIKIAYIDYETSNQIIYIEEFPFGENSIESVSIYMQFKSLIVLLAIILICIVVILLVKRGRIKLDKNHSCILEIKVDGQTAIIQCVISFTNTYRFNKKVSIFGDFKSIKQNKIIRHRYLKGIAIKSLQDNFDIPIGNSKFMVNFIDDFGGNKDFNNNLVIPKIYVIENKDMTGIGKKNNLNYMGTLNYYSPIYDKIGQVYYAWIPCKLFGNVR